MGKKTPINETPLGKKRVRTVPVPPAPVPAEPVPAEPVPQGDQMDHLGHGGGGNEITPPPTHTREPLSKKWCFTWHVHNSDHKDHMDQEKLLLEIFKDYIYAFQLERGEESGKLHWQGYVRAKARFRFKERWGKKIGGFAQPAKGDDEDNLYCVKETTRVGFNHTNIEVFIDPMAGLEFKPWQNDIINITRSPMDRRTIHWFWEPNGKVGKTTLAGHIIMHDKQALLLTGKAADMKNGIVKYIDKNDVKPKIIFMNLVRDNETFVSYQGLEEIKDGLFFSGKYEGGMVQMNPPHVIVFANFEPDLTRLSADRWHVVKIEN